MMPFELRENRPVYCANAGGRYALEIQSLDFLHPEADQSLPLFAEYLLKYVLHAKSSDEKPFFAVDEVRQVLAGEDRALTALWPQAVRDKNPKTVAFLKDLKSLQDKVGDNIAANNRQVADFLTLESVKPPEATPVQAYRALENQQLAREEFHRSLDIVVASSPASLRKRKKKSRKPAETRALTDSPRVLAASLGEGPQRRAASDSELPGAGGMREEGKDDGFPDAVRPTARPRTSVRSDRRPSLARGDTRSSVTSSASSGGRSVVGTPPPPRLYQVFSVTKERWYPSKRHHVVIAEDLLYSLDYLPSQFITTLIETLNLDKHESASYYNDIAILGVERTPKGLVVKFYHAGTTIQAIIPYAAFNKRLDSAENRVKAHLDIYDYQVEEGFRERQLATSMYSFSRELLRAIEAEAAAVKLDEMPSQLPGVSWLDSLQWRTALGHQLKQQRAHIQSVQEKRDAIHLALEAASRSLETYQAMLAEVEVQRLPRGSHEAHDSLQSEQHQFICEKEVEWQVRYKALRRDYETLSSRKVQLERELREAGISQSRLGDPLVALERPFLEIYQAQVQADKAFKRSILLEGPLYEAAKEYIALRKADPKLAQKFEERFGPVYRLIGQGTDDIGLALGLLDEPIEVIMARMNQAMAFISKKGDKSRKAVAKSFRECAAHSPLSLDKAGKTISVDLERYHYGGNASTYERCHAQRGIARGREQTLDRLQTDSAAFGARLGHFGEGLRQYCARFDQFKSKAEVATREDDELARLEEERQIEALRVKARNDRLDQMEENAIHLRQELLAFLDTEIEYFAPGCLKIGDSKRRIYEQLQRELVSLNLITRADSIERAEDPVAAQLYAEKFARLEELREQIKAVACEHRNKKTDWIRLNLFCRSKAARTRGQDILEARLARIDGGFEAQLQEQVGLANRREQDNAPRRYEEIKRRYIDEGYVHRAPNRGSQVDIRSPLLRRSAS